MIQKVLEWNNLLAAWNQVQEAHGAAGSDGVSLKRWGRTWEERLVNLRRAVMSNTYRPVPPERFTVPKRHGGVRHMINLTVTDKVLQRAVLNVLDDLFESIFLDCSYGYRPGRGLKDAVAAIVAYRDEGLTSVLDADIDECFDSLDHGLIMDFVQETVDDPIVLRLIELWLHQGRRRPDDVRGIPLGAVISPLLCNVYLHRLDQGLCERGHVMVRYADDWIVLCASRTEARRARQDGAQILAGLKLQYEPSKTHLTSFDQGFAYLGVTFYRRTYSYDYQNKRIEVEGPFDGWLFSQTGPEGYR
ncbi:MAG: reverse transcriptase domain-containing protein [Chloroflexota bacterium]|nr:reverse transcriptase domain-containing protein [Chloroflexota bacterium]